MTGNINKENVIELLSKIQITERGKRQVRLLELMSTPVLQKMVKLKMSDYRTRSTLIKGTNTWEPVFVFSSAANGDLLVCMLRYVDKTGKVNRYNRTGQYIETIQLDNKGQHLYSVPRYITENRNKNVIASDSNQIVVTDDGGKHPFSYTGLPSESQLETYGICTDVLLKTFLIMGSGLSAKCGVRHCSTCKGGIEYYCNTCKHDMCGQCKERHSIDLDTMYHDVVIYEELQMILTRETCIRHPDKVYEEYCSSCNLPVCAKCEKHEKHSTLDIRTAYKEKLEEHRDILLRIRIENIYNSCLLLSIINTEKINIFKLKLKMLTKANSLNDLIDTMMCDMTVRLRYKNRMRHRWQQQMRTLASIEIYEYRYKESTNRAVKFLLYLKNTFFPKITPNLTQRYMEDVTEFITETIIIERGQRQVRNEDLLELMSTPMLVRSVKLKTSGLVMHISRLTSDRFWISVRHNYIIVFNLINTEKGILHQQTSEAFNEYTMYGAHTVNKDAWKPLCVYSSTLNGDLLVGIFSNVEQGGKINRYNNTGQHVQTIEHDDKGQQLYSEPRYITQNCNGDVIVSDLDRVVVTDREGRHRFSYTGPLGESRVQPYGICTDALSHILVCDWITNTVYIIDKDGVEVTD
ncbi:uncharacterized protein LOC134257215 [Saccostrea cucullata]|uniref:uncharacterized protein LOC134257215 n=1 Tax=Saccostrea cuccullata TaxID=36930 RepID=UPI002ED6B498